MDNVDVPQTGVTPRKFFLRVLASWIVMMALDLVLNAGIFAKVWLEPSSFLLAPRELFRRIPLGYAAFLLQAVAWVWLTIRFGAGNWKQGSLFGLKLGAILNISAVLGLRSATTASWTILLVTWLIGGTLLTAAACLMAGFSSERGERRALVRAFLILIAAIVIIIIVQSTGLVPAGRMS